MIRILRVMEYTYDSVELAIADQNRWQVPANGVFAPPSNRQQIKSATMQMEILEDPIRPHVYKPRMDGKCDICWDDKEAEVHV